MFLIAKGPNKKHEDKDREEGNTSGGCGWMEKILRVYVQKRAII